MKKFLLFVLGMLVAIPCYAADTKVSALTADTTPTSDDLIYTVNDPGGTPASRKVVISDLFQNLTTNIVTTGTITAGTLIADSLTINGTTSQIDLPKGLIVNSGKGNAESDDTVILTTAGTMELDAGDDKLTATGIVFDLGGTPSFEIPNGAAPTTDAFGEIAGDNNAWASGRGAVQFYDGTANTYGVFTLASDVPTNGQVPMWKTGGTIAWENALNLTSVTASAGRLIVGNSLSSFDSVAMSGDCTLTAAGAIDCGAIEKVATFSLNSETSGNKYILMEAVRGAATIQNVKARSSTTDANAKQEFDLSWCTSYDTTCTGVDAGLTITGTLGGTTDSSFTNPTGSQNQVLMLNIRTVWGAGDGSIDLRYLGD